LALILQMRLLLVVSLFIANVNVYAMPGLERGEQASSIQQQTAVKKLLRQLPLYFEKNNGQYPPDFHFVAKTAFSHFAFTNDRVIIQLRGKNSTDYQQFYLVFKGVKTPELISANKKAAYTVNYYRGEKTRWRTNIETFAEIIYQQIYPGIDLKFYFNDSRLEYDFIVKAGVDPGVIVFNYENTDGTTVAGNDALEILVNNGVVQQRPPFIYQWDGEKKQRIQGKYTGNNRDGFRFSLAAYDTSKTLIIDPVIEFSSYFGGNWEDNATSIVTDSAGNIFLAGSTSAQARITVNNIMTLEHEPLSPLKGGLSLYDGVHGISLPAEYANGSSLNLNTDEYPCDYRYKGRFNRDQMVTDYDGFISKFDANYNLLFTTYFGGCRNDGIRDMVVANDNVYVAGFTLSDDLPSINGVQASLAPSRFTSTPVQSDAFYAKFDNAGELLFASYLGGDGRDGARAIAVDSNENLYITGYTHSTDLTSCSLSVKNVVGCENIGGIELVAEVDGGQDVSLYSDAFVAKISASGDGLGFMTYFGGSLDDWGQNIIVRDNASDPAQNGIYLSGNTASADLPTRSTGYSFLNYQANTELCSRLVDTVDPAARASDAHVCEDVFLAKISLDATELLFSTYLGGKFDDNVSDMEMDNLGNIYLFGTSRSQGARFALSTLLPPMADNLTAEQILQYQQDNAGIIGLLNNRFPLYKNIPELGFNEQSTSSMAFLTVFNADASELILSTFVGGSGEDAGLSVELNDDGVSADIEVYLGGHTLSDDFYSKQAFQKNANNSELYLVKLAMDLSKAAEPYDIPVCSDPDDPASCVNPEGSTCNNLLCDLYEIQYSTLIGGESLDAFKDMHYSEFDGGLFLAGTTYSVLFPVSANAKKNAILQTAIKDYNPLTRALELNVPYVPSDMFFMKLADAVVASDWELKVKLLSDTVINLGEKIKYEVSISANAGASPADLKSARLSVVFPYLAANERMAEYASVDNADSCEMEYKQIYCTVGDLAATDVKTLTISLLPRVSGNFPVSFSLMSMTGDVDMDNNSQNVVVRVQAVKSRRGAINPFFWLLLLMLPMLRFWFKLPVNPRTS